MSKARPQVKNANRHTQRGMQALETSIAQDGWIGAITTAADGETFDGSARVEKTAENGMLDTAIVLDIDGTKPVVLRRIDIPTADDPRAKRLGVAANRIAQLNLDVDPAVLDEIIKSGVDLSALYSRDEVADILNAALPEPGAGGDEFDTTPQDGPTRTALGDLWQIGPHRLLVGDCTDPLKVQQLMGDEKPLMMVTDPPYGVEYNPGWRNEAAAKGLIAFAANREGEVENDDRVDWSEAWSLFEGDVVYCWHADRHASSVQASLEACGFEVRSQVIWAKPRFVISRGHYHWQHEPCWYAVRKGGTGHWTGDRSQTTLWEIAMRDETEQSNHGTQKPIDCMLRPIVNHGEKNDIVYDPFLGSGTTLIAAHRTGRRCYGMEISPRYADVILRRAEAEGLPCERIDG